MGSDFGCGVYGKKDLGYEYCIGYLKFQRAFEYGAYDLGYNVISS